MASYVLKRHGYYCNINLGIERSYYILSENCIKDTSVFMICDNCGKIIINNDCLNSAVKIRLINNAEKHIFKNCMLKIKKFQIFFSGICDKCVLDRLEEA